MKDREEYISILEQDNAELKKQLEDLQETHYLIQGGRSNGKTYLMKLQQENQSLKKQVEELDKKLFFTKNELDMRQKSIDNKLNQQKDFIKYLEDEIKKISKEIKHYDIWHEAGDINFLILKKQLYIEILQKYKELIGGSDENN